MSVTIPIVTAFAAFGSFSLVSEEKLKKSQWFHRKKPLTKASTRNGTPHLNISFLFIASIVSKNSP
jgi:hypothetical protein